MMIRASVTAIAFPLDVEEQISVKVFSKGATNTIQCDWINTRVDEAETEADNARAMPVDVVDLIEVWVEVERQHEDVVRKKAHRENNDEDEHRKCYLPPCANLPMCSLGLPGNIPSAHQKMVCHQPIEYGDNTEWNHV